MMYILLVILNLSVESWASSCLKKTSIACCKDQFLNEYGKCVACLPGKIGYDCTENCPEGYYGLACRKECNCSLNETCNPEHGCIIERQTSSYDDSDIWKTVSFIGFPCLLFTCAMGLFIFWRRRNIPLIIMSGTDRRIVISNRMENRVPVPNFDGGRGGRIESESHYNEINESRMQSFHTSDLDHSHEISRTSYCTSKHRNNKRFTSTPEQVNGNYSRMNTYNKASTKRSFTLNDISERLRCSYDHIQTEDFTQEQKYSKTCLPAKTDTQADDASDNGVQSCAITKPNENSSGDLDDIFNSCEVSNSGYNGDNDSGTDKCKVCVEK